MRDGDASKERTWRLTAAWPASLVLLALTVACGAPQAPFEDRPITGQPGDDGHLEDPWAWPSESPTAPASASPSPLASASPSLVPAPGRVSWTADPVVPSGDWTPGGLSFSGSLAPGTDSAPSHVLWQVASGRQVEEVELLSEGRFTQVGTRYAPAPEVSSGRGGGPLVSDDEIVAAAPAGNLFAWMRESRAPLRLGKPFCDRVQALALTPSALWVSREGRVIPFRRDRLEPDTASASYVVDTRAMGGGRDGSLWLGLEGSRLVGIEASGQVRAIQVPGSGAWRDIALDEDAGFVVCLFRDALSIVDRAGNPVFSTPSGTFADASSVCVLPEGSLLVSDAGSGRLVRFRVVNTGLPDDK